MVTRDATFGMQVSQDFRLASFTCRVANRTAADTINSDSLAQLIDRLLDGWVQFVGDDGAGLSDWNGRTEAQVATIMTLTAHVHSTAMILRSALPAALTIAHMPLVRSIFESTITVAWCDEVADGANALINEGSRQRRNLRDSLARTHSMTEMSTKISVGVGSPSTSSDQQARRIEDRCADIALDGAYAFYRMLSGMSHASIDIIDAYLDGDSFRPGEPMSVKSNPGTLSSSFSWTRMIACCLVWSGMVTNYLDQARTRRNDLRRIARTLGVAPEIAVKFRANQPGRRR